MPEGRPLAARLTWPNMARVEVTGVLSGLRRCGAACEGGLLPDCEQRLCEYLCARCKALVRLALPKLRVQIGLPEAAGCLRRL